jgi:hypothetical protein
LSFIGLDDIEIRRQATGYGARNKPFRTGLVVALDPDAINGGGRVKVQFEDYAPAISDWLPITYQSSFGNKHWWLPKIGSQVTVLFDDRDEAGTVLGTPYSLVDSPPGATAPSPLKLTSDSAGSPSMTPLTGSLDDMFTQAALTCPGLATAISGVSGKNVLKALATSESSLNPNAVSEPARDGSRSWGIMQINTTAHPGYPPDELTSDVDLNIRLGTADLCGKLAHYGNINDAIGHYKGWSGSYGSTMSPTGVGQVNNVLNIAQGLGMS